MLRNLLLIKSGLRRAKGQTAAIAALVLSAALMLNIWLMLAMDYKQNFERCHERLNGEHAAFVLGDSSGSMKDFLSDILQNDTSVTEYYMSDALSMPGSFHYNSGEMNTEFVILKKEEALSRPSGRVEITEQGSLSEGIYLPMLYKTGEIAAGKTIDISIGSHSVNYPVCGFLNSSMAGSHNCGMCTLLLTQDQYQELEEKGYALKSVYLSVRIQDKTKSEDFEASLKNRISAEYPDIYMLSNSYAMVSSSRYISQMVCSGVVSAMAFFILIIVLVVTCSNILNDIQDNMKNLGVLKAAGYTGAQLIRQLLLQYLGITIISAAAGIAGSYMLFPGINTMMVSQTGIPYEVRFLPVPGLLTVAILGGSVAAAVLLSSWKIKKTEPVAALRQGMKTHNFKRNWISLEKSSLPVNTALAFKTACSSLKQNVIICITMYVLSLVVVFSGLMVENVITDMTPFVDLIVGETADSCINVAPGHEAEFLRMMEKDPRVEKVYLYTSREVRHAGGIELVATMSEDFSMVNNKRVCIEGRFPKYDNEMAAAVKYAKERHLRIGDEITLTADGTEAKYLICGFTQISNNLGKDCLLTRDGYQRMGRLPDLSYYLNLSKGTDIDAFNEEISTQLEGGVNGVVNVQSILEGTASVYVTLMKIIVTGILILSAAVIIFVLYLLVRTMLNRKKQEYGILKALGYTTGQLVMQTALCLMPPVMISVLVGFFLNSMVINPLTGLFLRGIGILKCTFAVPGGFLAAAGAGMIVYTFAMTCLLSLRIRKIVPREMLMGE